MKKFSKYIYWAAIFAIFIAALGIRLFDLTDPPMDFHPARQFHSALISRGLYAQWQPEAYPEWQQSIFTAQEASEQRIEPPIMEYLTAGLFYLTGQDNLWYARLVSILFWLTGGLGILLILNQWVSLRASLLALCLYFFLPYGVIASRAFQPESLMVAAVIFAFYFQLRWSKTNRWKDAVWAGLISGFAILTKQTAAFLVLFGFAGIVFSRMGVLKAIKQVKIWTIGILSLLPIVIYNLYGLLIGGLAGQYSQRFFPELWTNIDFYLGWLRQIDTVIGFAGLLLLLSGWFFANRTIRIGLAGLFAGYAILGLTLSHHISTHDYYSLPLIPLLALSAAPLFEQVLEGIAKQYRTDWKWVIPIILVGFASLYGIYQSRSVLKKQAYQPVMEEIVEIVERMGGYQVPVIGLLDDYGASVAYYGYHLPVYWWDTEDGQVLENLSTKQFEEIFEKRIAGKQYFVVSDFKLFDQYQQLNTLLNDQYTLFYESDQFLIYDLED